MVLKIALAALVAGAQLTLGAVQRSAPPAPGMRLIKTSEIDAGTWVTRDEIYRMAETKDIKYIDITNIKDDQVLERLSGKPGGISVQKAEFPSELSHVEEANGLIEESSTDGPKSWMDKLTSYNNRHCQSPTGVEAATWLFNKVKEIASANSAITVEQVQHSDFEQQSVIARIPGSREASVIIGSHLDSTSGSPSSKAPGADDNASGSVTNLEAFRVLAEAGFEPENTLEFHWYAGEEIGLVGSADIWADYKSNGKNVIAYVNQDMTGYSPSGTPNVVTDYTDPGLNDYVTLLVTEYTGEAPNASECGYACSDHASANSNGFPAAFLFEDKMDQTSPYIHSPDDTPSTIMWEAVERHIKFSIGYLVEASYI